MAAYDRSDRSTILPYQLEPTSTVADSESESTNSDYSSDSDSSAAMLTENGATELNTVADAPKFWRAGPCLQRLLLEHRRMELALCN